MRADVLIVGGGPAGSTAAMRLLQRGIRPVIVERERFPRYHIGESMTGEAGAILRELGFEDRMTSARHPVKYGVTVFGTKGRPDWWVPVMQRTEDKELHAQTTWQVRRSEFDTMLLDEAVARGAELIPGRAIDPIMSDDGSTVAGARVHADDGSTMDIAAEMTLDCSGQATFLANKKATGPKYLGSYDKQIAVFSQVANYIRDAGADRSEQPGNTHIFYKEKYHWAWAIPIDDEITSVGIVIPAKYFRDAGMSKADFIACELRELNRGLSARMDGHPELVETPHVIPNYSFQVRRFAGPGYICVGDSHRFVDPIFSFGLYVAMKEADLAAEATARYLDGDRGNGSNPFAGYMIHCERAIDMLEDMIDMFWENPLAFAIFAHSRYRDAVLDMFAGRVHDGQPVKQRDTALEAFRKVLRRTRTYEDDEMYSVPVGSRFHPERAPLWNSELDSVETTERWMRSLD